MTTDSEQTFILKAEDFHLLHEFTPRELGEVFWEILRQLALGPRDASASTALSHTQRLAMAYLETVQGERHD